MLEDLFGWRKASKCKVLIRRVRCRLKLLRNKRDVIVRQLKHDVVQLLKKGRHKSAFSRVEQLFKDQSILAAYDLLDRFCEFIILQLPYIRKHRDCPNDINEAVSSLIFAAARCADLPELQILRRLFGERYGQEFAVAAVELFPESLVNRQISEKLSIRSVSDDAKLRLIEEIAREYSLPLGPSKVEDDCKMPHQKVYGNNEFKWEKKVQERETRIISISTKVEQTRGSNVDKAYEQNCTEYKCPAAKETRFPATLSRWKKLMANPCRTHGSTNINSDSIIVVTAAPVRCNTPDKVQLCMNPSLPHGNTQEIDSPSSLPLQSIVETASTETLSERSTQLQEKSIVYLDDEDDGLYPSLGEDNEGKDDRVFTVKSKDLLQKENFMPLKIEIGMVRSVEEEKQAKGNGNREDGSYLGTRRTSLSDMHPDDCEIKHKNFNEWQERKTSTVRSSKRMKPGRQSLDKRSTPRLRVHHSENGADYDDLSDFYTSSTQSQKSHSGEGCSSVSLAMSMEDVEYATYYEEMDENSDVDSPCYSSIQESHHYSVLDSGESLGVRCELPSQNGKNHRRRNKHTINITEPELIRVSFPLKQCFDLNLKADTDLKSGSLSCSNVATWIHGPNQGRDRDNNDDDDRGGGGGSCCPGEVQFGSRERPCKVSSLIQGSTMLPPYSRSVTMPPLERPKCIASKQTQRSASFEQPCYSRGATHIHPKLPNYEDLAAKFTALKNDYRKSLAR